MLHWLASLAPSDVAARLMPMLVQAAVMALHEQQQASMPVVRRRLALIVDKATRALRAPKTEIKKYEVAAMFGLIFCVLPC